MMLSGKKGLGSRPWFGFCLSIALGVTLASHASAAHKTPVKHNSRAGRAKKSHLFKSHGTMGHSVLRRTSEVI